ncbi:hypothetical protein [Streptosporangium sp. NPDC087985]|uniref:hypothetical protein n=1 Tax=Streptosporangium sp. NPDC087985 TaxID=3366196 RepID=UPI0038064B5E
MTDTPRPPNEDRSDWFTPSEAPTGERPAGESPAAPGAQPAAPDVSSGAPERRLKAPRIRPGRPGRPVFTPRPTRPAPEVGWVPGPRRMFPDEQVWPPPPKPVSEPPGASTQPFPAIPAAPLPRRPPPDILGSPAGSPAPREESAGAAPPPRRRTALRVGALVLAVALGVGIPTWDGYVFYRSGVPDYRIHPVAAGGTGTLMNVAWKVRIEQVDALPGGRPIKPDQQWLKIKVTRTSLNTEGVIRRGDPEIKVKHPDGRTWQAEIVNVGLPTEVKDHRIGTGYDYDLISLVPRAVAGQVEINVIPSTIRVPLEEETVDELFKRAGTEVTEPQDQVLLFRR